MTDLSTRVDDLYTYGKFFDSLDTGILIVDQKGDIQVFNQWMEEHFLGDNELTHGKNLFTLFDEISERFQRAVRDCLSIGLSSVISTRLHMHGLLPVYASESMRQLDQKIPHSILIKPIKTDHKNWCLIQVQDAAERVRHDESLRMTTLELKTIVKRSREQEMELKMILDNTRDAIVIVNRLGRISSFYRSAQKIFKYKETEVLGKPMTALFPVPQNRRFEQILLHHDENSALSVTEQTRAINADGEIFDTDVAINSIDFGNSLHYVVTIKDISAQKQVQDALHKEKEQAQITLSSIADGVITTNIIGVITFANPAALKLTGFSDKDLLGKKIDRVITIQTERKELPVLECLNSSTQIESLSSDILIDKQGIERVIHQVASPIHNRTGDITGAVLIFRDVSRSHRLANRLSWQASHDELTGLFNRREYKRRLESFIDMAHSEHSQHCLIHMDLDKFKVVNDSCGHAAGDELLRQLSGLFQKKIRGADILARLGGDEFAIILNKCSIEPAAKIAEEIRREIEDFRFGWNEQSFRIGVSIGVVMIDDNSHDLEEVFNAADSACYAAKEAGRNRVHIYSADDTEISLSRGETQWFVRIQNALEHNHFVLFYQPIVELNHYLDGRGKGAIHYEILLRMVGKNEELIPPGAFISAAERYAQMSKIDYWVIENLFIWLSDHRQETVDEIFAINLSGQTLTDEGVLEKVTQLFDQYEIPAHQICFEITETAAISNLGKAQQFIDAMKKIGCQFALDDFGSGLSSFAYLKALKVDFLKIDGAFVKDIEQDPIDRAMVESIHNIGSVLNLKTIAEYVENDAIIEILKEVGVDFVQGYGVAKPASLPIQGGQLYSLS